VRRDLVACGHFQPNNVQALLEWIAGNDSEQSVLAFVRIATNSRAVRQPLSGPDACGIVDSWLERPNVAVVGAGDRFWAIFEAQVADARVSGPLVSRHHSRPLVSVHSPAIPRLAYTSRRTQGRRIRIRRDRPRATSAVWHSSADRDTTNARQCRCKAAHVRLNAEDLDLIWRSLMLAG